MLCQHNRPISDCLKCHKFAPPGYDDTDTAFYQDDDGKPLNEYGENSPVNTPGPGWDGDYDNSTDAWAGITAS